MQYDIGQNIVHPAHGAGTIVELEQNELVEGFKRYYVIQFNDKELTVRVPVRRTDDIGIRTVMSQDKFDEVVETLTDPPSQLPKNYKERRKIVENLVHSGFPVQVAIAIRELSWRREDAHLTLSDSRLLEKAREMLVQEMSLATGRDNAQVAATIDHALSQAIAAKLRAKAEESAAAKKH